MSALIDKNNQMDLGVTIERKHPQTPALLRFLVLLLDALVILLTAFLALTHSDISHHWIYISIIVVVYSLIMISRFQALNYYSDLSLFDKRIRAFSASVLATVGFSALIGIGYVTGVFDETDRKQLLLVVLAGGAAIFSFRFIVNLVAKYAAKKGYIARNVAIYGDGLHALSLIDHVQQNNETWNHVVGVFDQRKTRSTLPDSVTVRGEKLHKGDLDDLVQRIADHNIDELILALPPTSPSRILDILGAVRHLSVDIHLSPEMQGFDTNVQLTQSMGRPMINLASRPIKGWQRHAKDVLDRLGAVILLLILGPFLLLVALVLRLESRGPILFKQDRYGFNNKTFKIYKFRSMYADQLDANADKLVVRNDPRVTRVGSFLRKSSIDELPQLLNVLKGEMSLVGPRPHAINAKAGDKLYDKVVSEYAMRHRVKPGITGWAQVNGWRGETDTEEKILKRVEHDLYYIENWSIIMDARILILTVFAVLSTKNSF